MATARDIGCRTPYSVASGPTDAVVCAARPKGKELPPAAGMAPATAIARNNGCLAEAASS